MTHEDQMTETQCPEPGVVHPVTPPDRSRRRWVLWGGACLLLTAGLVGGDRWVYELSRLCKTPNPLDHDFYETTNGFWELLRFPGSVTGGLVAYFVLWAMHPRGWRIANIGLAAVLSADATAVITRHLIARVRPDHAASYLTFLWPGNLFSPTAPLSFPSGEATSAFALATVLACLYPRPAVLFYTAAALCALARLVAGAHYLSDVVAGGMLGVAMTKSVIGFADRIMINHKTL